ncbi:glycosyl hydrolase family 28-related protein [Methylobrevis pamukkalensis]|nr:glycosyl hydrolase family 28-related protein [Methylobrevis pamukkalensis]
MLVPARSETARTELAGLRGSFGAVDHGLAPGASDDQSLVMQQALDRAAREGRPLFLPPGRYLVSNLTMASGVRIIGIPGRSVMVYSGGGRLLTANGVSDVASTA